MTLFERVRLLANKQGKSINDVENELGYSKNTLYRLKKNMPGTEKLQEIADYFHVSTDYLLGRTDNPSTMPDSPKEVDIGDDTVIMTFDGKELSESDRQVVLAATRALIAQREKESNK